jgi:D-3-phosphoglycerate dehydrogenase
MKILVSTSPFATIDPTPLRLLQATGWDYCVNDLGREYTEQEIAELVDGADGIIAGTEPITARVLQQARNLKVISRVGVGLDCVDLTAARRHSIAVSYTPEAPAPAVSELAIGFMLDLLRGISGADRRMRAGVWEREMGGRLEGLIVGVIGAGRIGRRVIRLLSAFGARILAHDLVPDHNLSVRYGVEWMDKMELLRQSDVVSLHLPLTPLTRHYISKLELEAMKQGAFIVNTARGGMVDLKALEDALRNGHLAGAGLDVFDHEPYMGSLRELQNVVLTSHMGSCSRDCRLRMETEATEDCIRFLREGQLKSPVPEEEYSMRHEDVVYLVSVTPNGTFHSSGPQHVAGSLNPAYRDYRHRWYQNPALFKVDEFPLHLDMEVTGPEGENPADPPALVDFSIVMAILQEAKARRLPAVKFGFRGDPFLHPRLADMVAAAKEYGILDVYVRGEARRLYPEMAEALVKSGLDRITLTVPITAVQGEAFRSSVACIEQLRTIREQHETMRPRIRIQTYVSPATLGLIDGFAAVWRTWADEVAYIDLDYQRQEASARGIAASWACAKPWQSLCVTHRGEVLTCNHDFKAEMVLGRIETGTLAEIWHGAMLTKLRECHQQGRAHEIPICDKCVLRACEIGKLIQG